MTDPELADATYVEPLTPEVVERIIERSGPTRFCQRSAVKPLLTWPWSWHIQACSSATASK